MQSSSHDFEPRNGVDRFKYAIEATRDGIWDWDITTGRVFYSPQWARLLGYESDDVQQDVSFFLSIIHPNDIERVSSNQQQHFEGLIPEKQLEIRLRSKSGEYLWFLDRGAIVERDSYGKPTRMVGTITDINARKEAEKFSIQALSLLRATLESTTDGILVVNSDGKFEIYNQTFRKICGIPDEVLDAGLDEVAIRHMLMHVQDPVQFLAKIGHLYENAHESSFDTVHMKDGRVIERYSCPQIIDERVVGRVWSFRDVTERKCAEAAQAEALGRLQKIASRIPGVVYQYRLRADGTVSIPYASEGIRDLFNVEPSELMENADVSGKIVDYESFFQSMLKSARDLTPWVHEMQVRQSDGSLRWVAGNSVPEREPDGSTIWHGFITDVTERKLADAKLRESEKRLREAQAISQIGNFHWDARTQHVKWSDQLYRIYEKDPNAFEPTFENYIASIHPEDRERVELELQSAVTNKSVFDHHYRILLANERIRWVRARGNALVNEAGEFVALEGTCQDISEQKQNELITGSLEAQLRESQKMEAIGTLAGGIAHDFNNILATILGNVEIAIPESSDVNMVVRNCLINIRNAGDRARNLVQQILSFSRRQPTQRTPISLVEVVGEVANLLLATLPARVTLNVECSDDPAWILGDSTQMKQVLLNLATNAMQAMNGERGCIRFQLDNVTLDGLAETNGQLKLVKARSVGPAVRLIVSDDGPGMSAETLSRIFEPFFTTKAIDQGTGLGLAVVHGIVQRHDGVVLVESQLGHGATFTIYLPTANRPEVAQSADSNLIAEKSMTDEVPAHHILYLDDDEAVLAVAEQLLERGGFRASFFRDPQAALKALLDNAMDFDLVVTDYNMPGMHGLEVAREIRKIRQDLPIIITSGYVDAELTAGAEACLVQEVIAKPFRLSELFAVVRRLVKSK